jgi:hypothetical protein
MQLIYRGTAYNYDVQPQPRVSRALTEKMMQLTYRGAAYQFIPAEVKPAIRPRAINWRFRISNPSFRGAIAPLQSF